MSRFYVVTFFISLLQDGYQQNFKRGSGQSGPRGAPRGNSWVVKNWFGLNGSSWSNFWSSGFKKRPHSLFSRSQLKNKLTFLWPHSWPCFWTEIGLGAPLEVPSDLNCTVILWTCGGSLVGRWMRNSLKRSRNNCIWYFKCSRTV